MSRRDPIACDISALTFARAYAERGGMTLQEFAVTAPEREVCPCNCDYEECEGWQLLNPRYRPRWVEPGISIAELARQDSGR